MKRCYAGCRGECRCYPSPDPRTNNPASAELVEELRDTRPLTPFAFEPWARERMTQAADRITALEAQLAASVRISAGDKDRENPVERPDIQCPASDEPEACMSGWEGEPPADRTVGEGEVLDFDSPAALHAEKELRHKLAWLCHLDEVWPLVEAYRSVLSTRPPTYEQAVAAPRCQLCHTAAPQAFAEQCNRPECPHRQSPSALSKKLAMSDLHTAALKADEFAKLARFHLDTPRPERLEALRLELIEALGKLGR